MKKTLLTILAVLILVPSIAFAQATNLWQYFTAKGARLPSISERAIDYKNVSDDEYKGTASQNNALLDYLIKRDNGTYTNLFEIFRTFGLEEETLGGNIPVTATNWNLAIPLASTDTSIDLSDFEDLRGNVVESFPTKIYLVVEPENTDNTEIAMCTGYSTSTSVFSSCTRGLAFSGTSEASVTANKKDHPAGARVIMTNVGQFFNNFVDIDSAQTIEGAKTLNGQISFGLFPTIATSTDIPDANGELATKYYVDTVGAGGFTSVNASTTKGISVFGTSPETIGVNASTTAGLDFDTDGSVYVKASSTGNMAFDTNGEIYFSGDDEVTITSSTITNLNAINSFFSVLPIVPTSTSPVEGEVVFMTDSDKLPAVDGSNLTNIKKTDGFYLVPGTTTQTSATTANFISATSYTKTKEILFNEISGTIEVDFDFNLNGTTGHARIYKNGVAFGTDRTTTATHSENLSFSTGDLIQIYATTNGAGSVIVSNMYLKYVKSPALTSNTVNLN